MQNSDIASSTSLWNFTLSPEIRSRSLEENNRVNQILNKSRSECLPGKSIGQIYLQTQRIMGQQSLGDLMGLHVDIQAIFRDNMRKKNVTRKNNCIVNTGDNPTRKERVKNIGLNRLKYGLSKQYIKEIRIPTINTSIFKSTIMLDDIESSKFSLIEKIHHLKNLRKAVKFKAEMLGKREWIEQSIEEKFKGLTPERVSYLRDEGRISGLIIPVKKVKGGYIVIKEETKAN